jgi:hypothetical protein
LNIQLLNPLETPNWDDMLRQSAQATVFHTAAWARVLVESYGYTPLYFTLLDQDRLVGLIPVMEVDSFLTGKRGVALPFTDRCDPVCPDAGTFDNLLQGVLEYGRKARWKTVEFRGEYGSLHGRPAGALYLQHDLVLPPEPEAARRSFRSSTSRNIRKAENEGVSVSVDTRLESMAAYYRLHCVTRRAHGLPPQPWAFFQKIHEHMFTKGCGFVVTAERERKCIAGAVYFYFGNKAIYKFGASDPSFQPLRPNNLVMWCAIRWCCQKGIRRLSFGRTDCTHQGLIQFKRGWGAEEHPLEYYKYDFRLSNFAPDTVPKTTYSFCKIMPVPMLRVAGNLLYRHVA